ncbi:hypothetical protein [Geminicoccus roseus]|uniref:hypothetical protein n=1 Tax=Geminicoccus roseus TaxID=404900 RepID=UPI0003FC26EA|nr:hypothetical protein [Geminicoccus roseus]
MQATWARAAMLAGTIGAGILSAPLALAEGRMREIGNLRDRRFCEIRVAIAVPAAERLYSTVGLGDCSPAAAEAIRPEQAASRLGGEAATVDGPRHYLIDWLQSRGLDQPAVDVQGVPMRPVAERAGAGPAEAAAYVPHRIPVPGTYIYAAGETVYELMGDSRVYVMASYSQAVDPDLSAEDLAGLGERLKLPEGWRFRVRTLDQDLSLVSGDKGASVVVDELGNRYRRFELSFQPT